MTDQGEYENFCIRALENRREGSCNTQWMTGYSEAWVTAAAIRAIWVKEWADPATQKAARIMARNRNVPLITVGGLTRIWSLLDSTKLPVIPAIYAKPQRVAA